MWKCKSFMLICLVSNLLVSCNHKIEEPAFHNWPVLNTYKQAGSGRISMPVGGIGTGTISINGNGELVDIAIMDSPGNGSSGINNNIVSPFFAIYTRPDGEDALIRKLQGPSVSSNTNGMGDNAEFPEIPGFKKSWFESAYPFGVVHLCDNKMPVEVNLKTFNPLIPGEAGPSGTPIAILIYEVKNTSHSMVEVSVCGALSNFISEGYNIMSDTKTGISQDTARLHYRNSYVAFSDVQGIYMVSDGNDLNDPNRGTIALSTAMADSISYIIDGISGNRDECLEGFWNDFSKDGTLTKRETSSGNYPLASLAIKQFLTPGETRYFRFFLTWHFPNRRASGARNYYAADYTNAWDVAKKVTPYLPVFEENNVQFVKAMMESSVPQPLIEASVDNLPGLRSYMFYRDAEGNMNGMECPDSTQGRENDYSAWKYNFSFPFLFGRLSKTMSSGILMKEGIPSEDLLASVIKFYNDWQLSGDSVYLADNWVNIRKAVSGCLGPAGQDADSDGICDKLKAATGKEVYFSDNFRLQFFYLGALKASEAMARQVNDTGFASACSGLFEGGTRWANDAMINAPAGSYTISSFTGLSIARVCGLGKIIDSGNLKKALLEIYSDNSGRTKTSSIATGNIRGDEYATAALCIYEGLETEGIEWIERIRKRYDGKNGNPFSEAEDKCCETFSLASWAGIVAYTQFSFSAVTGSMSFTSRPGTYFWSDGYSWGTCRIGEEEKMVKVVEVEVYNGTLELKKFIINDFGERELSRKVGVIIKPGESFPFTVLRKRVGV